MSIIRATLNPSLMMMMMMMFTGQKWENISSGASHVIAVSLWICEITVQQRRGRKWLSSRFGLERTVLRHVSGHKLYNTDALRHRII